VVAVYRTGSGATGPLTSGTTPQPGGRLAGLDKASMPWPAVGGAAPETEATARVAGPGRMQSLGRLVSLADFEAEALALPGVLKARASWVDRGGIPSVRLAVLTASESQADADEVRDSMAALNRSKGPRRYALDVVQGRRRFVAIGLAVAYDRRRREADIRAALLEALGVAGDEANGIAGDHGLFGLATRQFGQSVHRSHVLAAVQHVDGVLWAELTHAHLVFAVDAAARRARASPLKVFGCPADRVLALRAADLTLDLTAAEPPEVLP